MSWADDNRVAKRGVDLEGAMHRVRLVLLRQGFGGQVTSSCALRAAEDRSAAATGSGLDGSLARPGWAATGSRAFTLIEFILVMGLLAIVMGVASPSLSRFFRGRTLDSEVRRMVSMIRYGQTRAASEGVAVTVWFDEEERQFGVQAAMANGLVDSNAVEWVLADGLEFEFEQQLPSVRRSETVPQRLWLKTGESLPSNLPTIRFEPDGFPVEDSVERLVIRQGEEDAVWVGLGRDRLHYEILTNEPPLLAGDGGR